MGEMEKNKVRKWQKIVDNAENKEKMGQKEAEKKCSERSRTRKKLRKNEQKKKDANQKLRVQKMRKIKEGDGEMTCSC